MKPGAILTAVLILSVGLLLSCGSDSVTGTDDGKQYSRATPEDVLLALAHAMEHRDIAIYDECVTSDYEFGFVPEDCDCAGVPEADPWWERAEDMAAMDSMFSNATVTKIEADFPVHNSWSYEGAIVFRCEPTIKVTVEPQGADEPVILWVFASWLNVKVVRDDADSSLWQISQISEELKNPSLEGGVLATEPATLGGIKAMFWRRVRPCEATPRSTPECLIETFEWAMMRRDIDAYDECLSDMYLFTFTSEDADLMGLPPDEPWWGKTQDVESIGNLFASADVATIWCDLAIASGPWPTGDGVGYRLEPDIKVTVEETHGPGVIYKVDASWLDVEIVPDPYSPEEWVFHVMEERLKLPYASEMGQDQSTLEQPSTFGSIKSMWR